MSDLCYFRVNIPPCDDQVALIAGNGSRQGDKGMRGQTFAPGLSVLHCILEGDRAQGILSAVRVSWMSCPLCVVIRNLLGKVRHHVDRWVDLAAHPVAAKTSSQWCIK